MANGLDWRMTGRGTHHPLFQDQLTRPRQSGLMASGRSPGCSVSEHEVQLGAPIHSRSHNAMRQGGRWGPMRALLISEMKAMRKQSDRACSRCNVSQWRKSLTLRESQELEEVHQTPLIIFIEVKPLIWSLKTWMFEARRTQHGKGVKTDSTKITSREISIQPAG